MTGPKKKPQPSNVVRLASNIFAQFREPYVAKGLWWRPVSPGTRAVKSDDWQKPEWVPRPEHLDPAIGWGGGLALGSPLPDGTILGCLDVDDDRYVKLAIAVLGGEVPCARFGSKGLGIFVRAPVGTKYEVYNNKAGNKVGEGLYTGGFTVCPPTISPRTGGPYRWVGTDMLEIDLLSLPLLNPPLMRAALTSEHAMEIATGTDTHLPALAFVAQLRVAGAEGDGTGEGRDDYYRLVRALLPDDYNGNTLTELPRMVASAEKKFSVGHAAVGTRLGFPDMTKFGPKVTLLNTKFALGLLGVECRHNLFSLRYEVEGQAINQFAGDVQDPVIHELRSIVRDRYGFEPGKHTVMDAVQTLANQHRYHPVRDYLDGLVWDGAPRIGNWLMTYCGAEDDEFNRMVGQIVLVACVRRVRQPGCKFDEMLVLESPEGRDKSNTLQTLAIRPEWFSDQLDLRLKGRETIEQSSGKWLCEIAELQGMRKAEIEHVKAWLSRFADRGRLAYAMNAIEAPRQFVPFGTTNSATYLRSQEGNRRFWPVHIQRCDVGAIKRDRDQLWAEAAKREAEGASIRLPEHLWSVAAEKQSERTVENPLVAPLASLLGELEGKVTTENLWCGLGIPIERQTALFSDLGNAMRDLGWERNTFRIAGSGTLRGYTKGPEPRRPITCYPPDRRDAVPGFSRHNDAEGEEEERREHRRKGAPEF